MSKRPAYQWYPGDFQRDTALKVCSFEVRALWREMLDIMHDGEPYGHLTAGGLPIADAELAKMIGKPVRTVTAWLFELESRKVFSRTPEGVIYSRRMVRDERLRSTRAAGGKLGGNPALMDKGKDNDKVNLPPNLPPTPAVAVAVAVAVSSSSARETLLAAVPHRPTWEAVLSSALQGMHGPPLTPEQLDRAVVDYVGNGNVAPGKEPSLRHFRAYLQDVGRAPAKSNGIATIPVRGAAMFGKIRELARSQNGSRFIPRDSVAELGADVLAAYEQVGGAAVFLACPPDKLSYLQRDFSQALEGRASA